MEVVLYYPLLMLPMLLLTVAASIYHLPHESWSVAHIYWRCVIAVVVHAVWTLH